MKQNNLSNVLISLCFSMYAYGQIPANVPWYKHTDQRSVQQVNYNDYVKSAELYFNDIDTDQKGSGYKPFKRWQRHWEAYIDTQGNIMSSSDLWKAWEAKQAIVFNTQRDSVASNWYSLGPSDFIDTGNSGAGQGRINVVLVDPNNPNIYYVGAPAGGLWKSINAGQSWVCLTDYLPQMGVSGIAVDPKNSDIIYITTGDDDSADSYFVGVVKSINGGQTWQKTGKLPMGEGVTANEIYIDPTDSNIVWVATTKGLFKSIDAGQSWELKLKGNIRDFKLKPNNAQTIYAVTNSKFYKSTDGGLNFNVITKGFPKRSSRLTIDVTPAKPDFVYVLSAKSRGGFSRGNQGGSFQGVYFSSDAGSSFVKTAETDDIFNASKQSYYDFAICVSDIDPNEVYVGVLNIWKSTDRANDFTQINHWNNDEEPTFTHADIHFLRFYDGVLFAGTDGGVYRSIDHATSFQPLNKGLTIGQFYSISVSERQPQAIVGGLQDNGGYTYYNGKWYNYHGGDGLDSAIDPTDGDVTYGFIQNGHRLFKSIKGQSILETSQPSGEGGEWLTPLVVSNLGDLYAGYFNLYQYNDKRWIQITQREKPYYNIDHIELDPQNQNLIYYSRKTELYRVNKDGTDQAKLFDFKIPITCIEVNNNNTDIIYVTTRGSQGKVYKSIDKGKNFVDISANLPSQSKNVIKHHKCHPNNALYLGTYLGVYYLDDTSDQWRPFFNNLPNVHITDLEVSPLHGKLTAATYGRGVWQTDIALFKSDYDLDLVDVLVDNTYSCNNDIVVKIKNKGKKNITHFDIVYMIDDKEYKQPWEGSLASEQTIEVHLNPNRLLHQTNHSIVVSLKLSEDNNLSNNTLKKNFFTNNTLKNPAISESFENYDKTYWLVENKPEGDTTGQSRWHLNSGVYKEKIAKNSSGYRAYFISSENYTNSTTSLLYTPCIDLTTLQNPVMKFYMSFDLEKDKDVLYIEYTADKGETWHILGTAQDETWYNSNTQLTNLAVGKQWTGKGYELKEYSYNLDSLTDEPNVIFRFHFASDEQNTAEGVMIDDFRIEADNIKLTKDLTIDDIEGGYSINCGSIHPIVKLKNMGQLAIQKFAITFTIDNTIEIPVSENDYIAPGGDYIYSLSQPIEPGIGTHSMKIEVATDADDNLDNNIYQTTFVINNDELEVNKPITFESEQDDTWLVETKPSKDGNLWRLATPQTEKLNKVSSGEKAYITNPKGKYTNSTVSYLYTPCITLNYMKNPMMKFNMAFDIEKDWDVLYIEYSKDRGETWEVLGTAQDPNWYNNTSTRGTVTIGNQWSGYSDLKTYVYDLKELVRTFNVVFRFHFESDNMVNAEGVLIDDFQIVEAEELNDMTAISTTTRDVRKPLVQLQTNNEQEMLLSPNPSKGKVTVTLGKNTSGKLSVLDLSEKTLLNLTVNNLREKTIDLGDYAKGVYLIKFKDETCKETIIKIILE